MGIKMTGLEDTIEDLRRKMQKIEQDIIDGLSKIGQKVVKGICDGSLSNWIDRTGNLRSSVGFIVVRNAQVVREGGFSAILEGGVGASTGRAYAYSLIPTVPSGIALIVVAGMEYASYVEKIDNKTVLAQGELEADRLVMEMIQELNRKYDLH